jgi:hypothetical protein
VILTRLKLHNRYIHYIATDESVFLSELLILNAPKMLSKTYPNSEILIAQSVQLRTKGLTTVI